MHLLSLPPILSSYSAVPDRYIHLVGPAVPQCHPVAVNQLVKGPPFILCVCTSDLQAFTWLQVPERSRLTIQHYALAIKTDLQALRYYAEALIDLSIKADTSTLTFNIHPSVQVTHLAISSSELKSTSSVALSLSELSVDEEQERGVIKLDKLPGGGLKAGGEAKLWIRFEAELGGSMAGYYKSEGDVDAEGKKAV